MYDFLKGVTIVEGSAFVAGPTCALHFAQMGAKVIRFDQIGGGPDARRWPLGPDDESLYWEGLNKGKRSIAIDFKKPAGRELAQRLATGGSGLFVTNFPVDGFLSHDVLSALREDQITLRVMGWADGTPAVDYTVNAATGLPYMTGPSDDDRPVNHVLPAWDLLTGAYGAFTLLAAERDRAASGRGREIRLALSDIAAASLANLGFLAEAMLGDADRGRSGNNLYGAFGRDFTAKGGERFMIVAITPRQWSGMLSGLEIGEDVAALEADLGIDFGQDEGARYTHRNQLDPLIEKAFARFEAADLETRFAKAGVTWSRYRSLHQALSQEPRLFADNPIFSETAHPGGATYPAPGAAARIPQDERRQPEPAPKIGQHTDEVLADFLNLDSSEIARLHDQGVVK
ncbi:CoA transferase [Parasphingopyxis lamellibrachiae]|uniref:2-methylfumaryl-CoA isomerase n=1 Tax=Parasphingopyxis lamellibrachiae TaxID=680125 RepID=A0A3D9FL14_9SPHN|nr:CoA transferase [Parasphingopyxis lamellibrachiae]RED17786.1 2-methylfumaryl-CoA isomerase [Parasphingopyxis lamellibrachiae]